MLAVDADTIKRISKIERLSLLSDRVMRSYRGQQTIFVLGLNTNCPAVATSFVTPNVMMPESTSVRSRQAILSGQSRQKHQVGYMECRPGMISYRCLPISTSAGCSNVPIELSEEFRILLDEFFACGTLVPRQLGNSS